MTGKDLEKWLRPWPLSFDADDRRAKVHLHIVPLRQAARLKLWWEANGGRHYTVAWWAQAKPGGKRQWPTTEGHHHYVRSLVHSHIPVIRSITVIVWKVKGEWVVVDGNHHLLAAVMAKREKRPTLTHIGIVALHGWKP